MMTSRYKFAQKKGFNPLPFSRPMAFTSLDHLGVVKVWVITAGHFHWLTGIQLAPNAFALGTRCPARVLQELGSLRSFLGAHHTLSITKDSHRTGADTAVQNLSLYVLCWKNYYGGGDVDG